MTVAHNCRVKDNMDNTSYKDQALLLSLFNNASIGARVGGGDVMKGDQTGARERNLLYLYSNAFVDVVVGRAGEIQITSYHLSWW